MSEQSRNLWAPWRMEYLDDLDRIKQGCFVCTYRDDPATDEENYVLWRTEHCLVVMNRFPYTSGHLLVAPREHVGELDNLPEAVLCDLMLRIRDCQRILRAVLNCEGFNIGINLGHCAGAGLPEHLHWHIVPRWSGDTNFMAVVGDARVIPQSMAKIQKLFGERGREIGLL